MRNEDDNNFINYSLKVYQQLQTVLFLNGVQYYQQPALQKGILEM